ncbi:MAG: glycosyltransferase [Vicingaceae bacterium]
MVSVVVITFKHEQFIAKTLDSILAQKRDFDLEILIGEDCSPDSTRQICEDYQKKHSDIIRLLPSKENLGVNKNILRTISESKGDYVAFCEGDDYWIDQHKLQKQVDFLTENPLCFMSTHDAVVMQDGKETGLYSELPGNAMKGKYKRIFTTEDTFEGWFLHTATLMHRNKKLDYPSILYEAFSFDVAYISILSKHGTIGYIDQAMSCYRKHPGGISFTGWKKGNYYLNWLTMYDALDEYFDFKYHKQISKAKEKNCYWYFEKIERESNELIRKMGHGELDVSYPMLLRIIKGYFRRKLKRIK